MTQQPLTPAFTATVLGYPRTGPRRELKRALEATWAGRSTEAEFLAAAEQVQAGDLATLTRLGLEPQDASLPGDVAAYDHVLRTTAVLGAVPTRFADRIRGGIDLQAEFLLARGDEATPPLELTKYFDTNYHYLVPEIGPGTPFRPDAEALLAPYAAHAARGFITRPTLVGPLTYLLLAKAEDGAPEGFDPLTRLEDAVDAYAQTLAVLGAAGVPWVQLDEPGLSTQRGAELLDGSDVLALAYARLADVPGRPRLFVTAGYGGAGALERPGHVQGELARLGIEAVHADLTRGPLPRAEWLGDLAGATLVAGVVDSRNIWRNDLRASLATLNRLQDEVAEAGGALAVGTATSLLHVPHTVAAETELPAHLNAWLAFADEKVTEVLTLATGLRDGEEAIAEQLAASDAVKEQRAAFPGTRDQAVRTRQAALTARDANRAPADQRRAAQAAALGLPLLPTTTIGSYPQTDRVRRARADVRAGRITQEDYEHFLREEIRSVVRLQEEIGLDVLVHGEAERNDMVQYFAEHFDGFAATTHGWVQSYGSRCTRPSILWGDVSRPEAFTVPWISYAASLTSRPLKGMLTGPVTILAWSFVRDDQPRSTTAEQVALALRDEIADLEAAGIGIIQVDEPALRELLPLRSQEQQGYLDWAVRAFRLATGGADVATQVHTHLCYSEFGEVIGAIDALDADVTSIEAARSRMEITADVAASGFSRGIGPGVYDIHSPRVPSVQEIRSLLHTALGDVPVGQLWVNPDCGLKTRGYEETEASLRHLVAAAQLVRAELPGAETADAAPAGPADATDTTEPRGAALAAQA